MNPTGSQEARANRFRRSKGRQKAAPNLLRSPSGPKNAAANHLRSSIGSKKATLLGSLVDPVVINRKHARNPQPAHIYKGSWLGEWGTRCPQNKKHAPSLQPAHINKESWLSQWVPPQSIKWDTRTKHAACTYKQGVMVGSMGAPAKHKMGHTHTPSPQPAHINNRA